MRERIENIVNSPIKDKNCLTITSKFGKRRFYNNIAKRYESNYHNGLDLIGVSKVILINIHRATM